MMGKWHKLGLFIKPEAIDWVKTGTIVPTAYPLDEQIVRVFFGGRDANKMSKIGFADIDFKNDYKIIRISTEPVVDLGELGCFDDCGVTPGSFLRVNDVVYLYYTGLSLHVQTMFSNHIGLVICNAAMNKFDRYSKAPVFSLNQHDPYHVGTPYVIYNKGKFMMWYLSGTKWIKLNDQVKNSKHFYTIKYAESKNGINWDANDNICIQYNNEEYAICRPSVIFEEDLYKMWYTYRGGANTYRIGYAESKDGKNWTRKDNEAGIDVSAEGWDSEMICYPSVFDFNGKRYMFYNGNGYGKTGIGCAVYNPFPPL